MIHAEELARLFHESYERLAPAYGYQTRKESAVAWQEVPANNKQLMIAVAGEVLQLLRQQEQAAIAANLARFCEVAALAARYADALHSDLCEQDKMQILLCARYLARKRDAPGGHK
jgi:hypothetical protein